MVMFPLTFLSNAFVPTDTMPDLVADLRRRSTRSPTSSPRCATWPTTVQVTAQVGWALLGCAVIVAVFAPLSVKSFTRKM